MKSRREAYADIRRETRTFTVEHRTTDDGQLEFRGYASTYGDWYTIEDFFGEYEEQFVEGAFTRTLADRDDVVLLINHEGLPLARSSKTAKTLTLSEDQTGLLSESLLDPTDPDVMRIKPKMDRGDLSQMSIAFRAIRQEWDEEYTQRKILEARLYDVSIVTNPANPFTSAGLRGIDAIRAIATQDPEELLVAARDAGGGDLRGLLELAHTNLASVLEWGFRSDPAPDDEVEATPEAPADELEASPDDSSRDGGRTISLDMARRQIEVKSLERSVAHAGR